MNAVHVRVVAGGEHYAIPVTEVLEIAERGEVAPVPGAPHGLLGVRNLNGRVIPLIDLASMLGLGDDAAREWIVVSESRGSRCGLVVAEVRDVGGLPEAEDEVESPYLTGSILVDGALVGVVDVAAILDALSPAVPA